MSAEGEKHRRGPPAPRHIADAPPPRPEPPPRQPADGHRPLRPKQPVAHALHRSRVLARAPTFLPATTSDDPAAFDPTQPVVSVVLEFLGSVQDLPALGALPLGRAGNLVAAYANTAALGRLHEHPATLRLEEGRPWVLPALRRTAEASPIPREAPAPTAVHSSPQGHPSAAAGQALSGRDVRLAVLDLGFDFLHPAFLAPTTAAPLRTLWLQDFSLPPVPGAQLPGRRFEQAELQAALDWYRGLAPATPQPEALAHLRRLSPSGAAASGEQEMLERHGTAVAGIAAGIAPGAELALIAICGSGEAGRFTDSTDMLAGFAMAFADCPPPCVAVMANSDNLGPHDGTLAGERFLEELLLLPGRAIVVTVGNLNHGSDAAATGRPAPAFHATIDPPDGSTAPQEVALRLAFDEGCEAEDVAEVWFHAPPGTAATASISASLCPDIAEVAVGPVRVALDTPQPVALLDREVAAGGSVTVTLAEDPVAGGQCLRLTFRPGPDGFLERGCWTIAVTAQGPVHAWLTRHNQGRGHWVDAPARRGADHVTLGSPACAARLLAVGSVQANGSTPSQFSGRGPVRRGAQTKPDLVAIGEGVIGPLGSPADRLIPGNAPSGPDHVMLEPGGTSYAAPQVAGACALLFEHFGPAATWADLRQVLLESAHRSDAMPPPDATGWDPACGHGLLDLANLLQRRPPTVDLWLANSTTDDGFEPYVDWTFWASPDIVIEDAAGRRLAAAEVALGTAEPGRIRVSVRNRGTAAATGAVVKLYWAPLGVLHPLPGHPTLTSPWQQSGLGTAVSLGAIPPGGAAEALFSYTPPRPANGPVRQHMLLATIDVDGDRFIPTEPLSARNNAAALSIAAASGAAPATAFTLLGSPDNDGAILWLEGGNGVGLIIEDLPVSALPWRDAGLFARQHWRGQRPRSGDAQADPAAAESEDRVLTTPAEIEAVTDIQGATRLTLRRGRVRIEGCDRLLLPRLRLALGTPLRLLVAPTAQVRAGALHLLHLSGGRRVGGGTLALCG